MMYRTVITMICLITLLTVTGNVNAQHSADPGVPDTYRTEAAVTREWQWPRTDNGAYGRLPARANVEQPLSWEPLRGDDIMWHKRVWREVNVLELQNAALRYAGDEHTGGGMFIEILMDAISRGKVTAYNTVDDRFTTILSREELHDMVVGKPDTEEVYELDGTSVIRIIEHSFNPATVTKYRVMEDWMVDRNTGRMVVRLVGIAPVRDVYGADGQYRGPQAMFWLYYPAVRGLLAGYKVATAGNDALRPTWDDFFEGRMFSSRVTKVSNIHGGYPGSYGESFAEKGLSSMEALYEGRRVADGINAREQDMWTY